MTKNIFVCLMLCMILGAMTACSQQLIPNSKTATTQPNTSDNTQAENQRTQGAVSVPAPNVSQESMENEVTEMAKLPSPVVAPPSYNNRPLKPGETPAQQTYPNGLPALSPLKGVNVDTLFAENIKSTDRRFDRVENAVKDMRKEFEVLKPAIVRLVAVESDIQKLVEQLEKMAAQEHNNNMLLPPETTQPQPMQQKGDQPPQAPLDLRNPTAQIPRPNQPQKNMPDIPKMESQRPITSSATGQTKPALSSPHVKNLRIGQHKDKVRLVLDLSQKTPYTIDLDQSENILLIELPNAKWSGVVRKTFDKNTPVLSAYEVEDINNGQGSRLIIALKQSSAIMQSDIIPPGSVSSAYRLFIDLKR